MTPKAIINQKFGDKARYTVEEVRDLTQSVCPGLAISQNVPCLFRCTLELPETVVISDTFKRKKDAEQSAAGKAIEKLGIRQKEYNPTVQEAWDDLARHLDFLFGNEFLSSSHPLSGHFRAALSREGHLNGCVPVSVVALYDSRISNICKYIDPAAESSLLLVMSLVLIAAKQANLVLSFDEQLSLRRRNPYPPEILPSSTNHESGMCDTLIEVIRIPASPEKDVESLKLNITATCYYLDIIGHELGIDASKVRISRTIGKASSELRIYFSASTPLWHLCGHVSDPNVKQVSHFEGSLNERATYFSGQDVYGDAILALVGYTWKSAELIHEDVSLRTYYRMLVNKIPGGAYKISRQAILAAKLPLAITTRSNWSGSFPREILCTFCRSHHLSEPVFAVQSHLLDSSQDLPGSCKKLKVKEEQKDEKTGTGHSAATGDVARSTKASSCQVKIYSKNQELILQCSPQESYRKQIDAIQNAALKVLSFLNTFFENPDMSLEELNLIAEKVYIRFTPNFLSKEFELCHSVHKLVSSVIQASNIKNHFRDNNVVNDQPSYIDIWGQNSGITPSNGSLACISYTLSLVTEGECLKEHLERCEEFEFEIGNEAVLPSLEAAVVQITVGQSACFQTELLPYEFILAAAFDSAATRSLLLSKCCKLEYDITLLQVTEPLEERMEHALFSPPLSKQRVEFAVQQIKESSAVSLVDFGCGSGSLLDSLLLYPTLEKIVGADISKRSLARAAKSLHTKLNSLLDTKDASSSCVIKSAVLYDGSITKFDSRLHRFDIATCLEVIEHMEEEDASLFGDVVLRYCCPKILIISTPNYEYNVILQQSTPQSQEEDLDGKNQPQSVKFRNHDHKFEWTRAQFHHWASCLAARHNYCVEFSGVGGSADVEPGFASQIAIFRRLDYHNDDRVMTQEFADHYVTIWEWNREDLPTEEE